MAGTSNTPQDATFMDASAIGGVFSYLHQCAGTDEQTLSLTVQAIYHVLPPRDRAGFVDAATMSGLSVKTPAGTESATGRDGFDRTDDLPLSVDAPVDDYGTDVLLPQHGPWSHPCTARRVALGYGTCSTVCAFGDFYHLDRLQRLAYLALHPGAPLARAWESVE